MAADKNIANPMVFSVFFVVLAFFSKPMFDVLYFIGFAKYIYFIIFFSSGFVSWVGLNFGQGQSSRNSYFSGRYLFIFFAALYFACLVRISLYDGGDAEEIIRKLMPFIGGIFLLTLPASVPVKKFTAYICAAVIFSNAATIPFGWSWTYWGGVHTFKGLYYFKMDLAFTIVLALAVFFYARDKVVDIWFVVVSIAASVMVVLSNSRMNYMLVAMVFIYSALSNGVSIKTLINVSLGVLTLGGAVFVLYDPDKALGFDFYNMDKFTQGRNHVWDALLDVGFYRSKISDVFLGHGLNADWRISSTYGGLDQVHDAHNEVLHLLVNQGVIGFLLYTSCWILMVRAFGWKKMDNDAKIFLCFVGFLFFTQGMTAVLSSYYLKTWWMLLAILLASYSSGARVTKSCMSN